MTGDNKMKTLRLLTVIMMVSLFVGSVSAEYIPFVVKLNSLERLLSLSLLPSEGSYATWKVINDLRNELAFTSEELTKLDLQPAANGGVQGNWDAVPEKEITFGETTEKMIVDALTELDSNEKLTPEHLSLYQKFVIREELDEF